MALFACWRDDRRESQDPAAALAAAAHVAPEASFAGRVATTGGGWRFAAFATATYFYTPAEQVWQGSRSDELCLLHGLCWQARGDEARLLAAGDIAALLDRPGASLPEDVAGEYAIVRIHADGTLEAFGDAAGLHHLFHDAGGRPIVANRARFVALLAGAPAHDWESLAWLGTIGYRVGTGTAWASVAQLPQRHRLTIDAVAARIRPSGPALLESGDRAGLADQGDLFEQGLVQAVAALRLATARSDRIDLPITGGKDSRAVLALALRAGLGDRLTLFTRGYEGHPDVVAGRGVAEALGIAHRREPPQGSDQPAHWSLDRFVERCAAQTFQTDGMMGGWDHLAGERLHRETLITGHMGEVLKAYSKRPLPDGPLDPVAMIRLQAPFDPLGLLRPEARAVLIRQVAAQMAEAGAAGATREDQPDLFYLRNRIPNWLGGIRGIKSFERQPVMPLGVPAFMRLAFRMPAAERKAELAHFRIIEAAAPKLLAPPFAMQSWDAGLAALGAPMIEPIRPGAAAPPVFGNWQYSVNSNPAIRGWLADLALAQALPLWDWIDRYALVERLASRRFDYFDGISLLGLAIALCTGAGIEQPLRLGEGGEPPVLQAGMPLALAPDRLIRHGHLDTIDGPVETIGRGAWRLTGDGALRFIGWLHCPSFPAAQLAVQLMAGEETLALAVADRPRADLARAGIGDGAHGFAIAIGSDRLRAAAGSASEVTVTIAAFDSGFVVTGGTVRLMP